MIHCPPPTPHSALLRLHYLQMIRHYLPACRCCCQHPLSHWFAARSVQVQGLLVGAVLRCQIGAWSVTDDTCSTYQLLAVDLQRTTCHCCRQQMVQSECRSDQLTAWV